MKTTGKGTGVYRKGLERRERMLDAAEALLANAELDEISLKDIAERAGVPVSSAYHFFDNAHAVYKALGARFSVVLNESLGGRYSASESRSWQSLFDAAVDRGARVYGDSPAYAKLILGARTSPDIKIADRANDEHIGGLVMSLFERSCGINPDAELSRALYFAIEIVDLMFSLSVQTHGEITPTMVAEAKRAGKAYLSTYLAESGLGLD